MRDGFKIEMRNVKKLTEVKTKALISKVFENLKDIFKKEYNAVVKQYNAIREQLYTLEKRESTYQNQAKELEYLNAEKDTFYDHLPIKFIDMLPEMGLEYIPLEDIHLDQQEVHQASSLFNKTFSFYGGYAQLSANVKDELGESKILSQLIQHIQNLKQ